MREGLERAMKMPGAIDKLMFSPCGMNCMVCYVHLKMNKPCSGCLADDMGKPERCKNCALTSCAKEKGITYCLNCADYPCSRIKNMEKSYRKRYQTSLIENSRYAQAHGLKAFFEKEIERWTCKDCSGIVSLHDRTCSECGTKID
jgi:hypothetical protein